MQATKKKGGAGKQG